MSDYQEMLDPKVFTRRPGWQAKIRIKHLLTDNNDLTPQQVNEIGKQISATLMQCSRFNDEEIITGFDQVDDMEEFNSLLDDMYDVCDDARIWVEQEEQPCMIGVHMNDFA